VRVTYGRRVHLKIEIVRIDDVLDDILQCFANIGGLSRADVLNGNVDVGRMASDDGVDGRGVVDFFCDSNLESCQKELQNKVNAPTWKSLSSR
jgi:hypothetical protein